MGCQITKDLTSLQRPLSSVPRWPLWRGSTVFKNTLEVLNYHVHLYVALLNLQFLIFFFRQKREKKICLEQGCNNRGVAEVGTSWLQKRDHIKLPGWFCEPSFILLVVAYWILEKYLVLEMFADTGLEVIECDTVFAEISCCIWNW